MFEYIEIPEAASYVRNSKKNSFKLAESLEFLSKLEFLDACSRVKICSDVIF